MPANNYIANLKGITGDVQSPQGHVEIDSDPYLLVPGHYLSYPITPFAPKQAEGDPSYQNYSDADSPIAQSSWHGGMARFRDISPVEGNSLIRYFEGENTDGSRPHRLTISPLQVVESSIAVISATKTLEFGSTMVAMCGAQIVSRNDTTGVWAIQFTFANTITDIVPFGGNLFVGFGDVADAQYSAGSNLTSWTVLTGRKATVWAADKDVLYRFFAKNQVDSSADGIAGWGTTILTGVGDTGSDFTSAISGGVLAFWYAVKADGMYDLPYVANTGQTLSTTATARKVLPFPYRSSINGAALAWHGPKLYVTNGHSLWEFQPDSRLGGVARDISPWLTADMIGKVKGDFYSLFPSPKFLYGAIVDTTSSSGQQSYILRRDWDTDVWHTWVTPKNGQCKALYLRVTEVANAVEPANPALYYADGTNITHIILPTFGYDPLGDSNTRYQTDYSYDAPQGQLDPTKNITVPNNTFASPPIYNILPFRDLNLPDEDKVENTIRVVADRLNGGMTNIAVDYNEDELRDSNGNLIWTFVGRASTSPVSELFLPTGANRVIGKRQMLRIRPYTADNTKTPVLRAIVAHKRVLVQVRWGWDITVMIAQRQTGRNEGMTWIDPYARFRKLQRIHERGLSITFKDRDGYTYTCLIASVSLTEVQEPNTSPQWAIQLRLIQAQFGLAGGINNSVGIPIWGAGEAATVGEEAYIT